MSCEVRWLRNEATKKRLGGRKDYCRAMGQCFVV